MPLYLKTGMRSPRQYRKPSLIASDIGQRWGTSWSIALPLLKPKGVAIVTTVATDSPDAVPMRIVLSWIFTIQGLSFPFRYIGTSHPFAPLSSIQRTTSPPAARSFPIHSARYNFRHPFDEATFIRKFAIVSSAPNKISFINESLYPSLSCDNLSRRSV